MLPGLTQWFSFEDRDCVEKAADALADLGATRLRTLFSWADFEREGGAAWLDYLVETLARVPNLDLLPALFYTPPARAMQDRDGATKTSYPPHDLSAYGAFVRNILERYGERFEWIQLWNEPNWKPYWDWNLDPNGDLFARMAGNAAKIVHQFGKQVALGGTAPLDYAWLSRMHEQELLQQVDAVAFHYAPSWDNQHRRWFPLETELHGLRGMLAGFGLKREVWLDETGISTLTAQNRDEKKLEERQVEFFDQIRTLSADRIYWYCLFDQKEDTPTDDQLNLNVQADPTAYHFGLLTEAGREKPLYRHWKQLAAEGEKSPALQRGLA